MSDRFTVVFKGDIRAFDGNPLHVVSPFGEVVAGGVGDEFAVADALRAENARLIEERESLSKSFLDFAGEQGKDYAVLKSENARLREALKPIIPDKVLDEEEYSLVWNFHLNAARAAMGESDE